MAGTALVILLFVILGNPAAGGAFARPLLPGFWATVGGLLPPGAGVDSSAACSSSTARACWARSSCCSGGRCSA
jgi:hypothetical protein